MEVWLGVLRQKTPGERIAMVFAEAGEREVFVRSVALCLPKVQSGSIDPLCRWLQEPVWVPKSSRLSTRVASARCIVPVIRT